MIDDPALAALLNARFTAQVRQSREIDLAAILGWSPWKRLAYGAARLFSPLL
jgi:hypothetical protein